MKKSRTEQAQLLQTKLLNLLEDAELELKKNEGYNQETNRLGLLLGVSPDGLNTPNAQRAVSKAVLELVEARQQAKDNGYSSLAFALKALGQKTPDLQLPEWALYAPSHWTVEPGVEKVQHVKNSRTVDSTYKVKGVTALQAQHQLNRLKPTIKLVLDELNWDPEETVKVKDALTTLSYTDFQQELFGFLRRVTEKGEDEAVTETGNEADPELEASLEEMRQALGDEFDEDAARTYLLVKN
jgi:hypothetical protein